MPEDTPGIEGAPTIYYSDAKIYEEDSTGITVDLNFYNIITSPPQYEPGLSCRYFIDLSEYSSETIDMDKFITKVYYSPAGAEISPLKPWDEENNIYYVEISFPNPVYARTYVQFAVYYYENELWDSSNDFSYKGMSDTYATIENIPVYKDGVHVAGKDPSGGEGVVPTPNVTPTPTPKPSDYIHGDVNGDKEVDSLDFAAMRQHLLGIIKDFTYEMGNQAADLDGDGEFDSLDFACMRLYMLGIIKEFPVEAKWVK